MWYVFHHEKRIEHTVPGNGVRVLTFVDWCHGELDKVICMTSRAVGATPKIGPTSQRRSATFLRKDESG